LNEQNAKTTHFNSEKNDVPSRMLGYSNNQLTGKRSVSGFRKPFKSKGFRKPETDFVTCYPFNWLLE